MFFGLAMLFGGLIGARARIKVVINSLLAEGVGYKEIKKKVLSEILLISLFFFVALDGLITNSGQRVFSFQNSEQEYLLSQFLDKWVACIIFYVLAYFIYIIELNRSRSEH